MNKKRILCAAMAAAVVTSSSPVYADKLSSIGSSKDGEVRIIGTTYSDDADDGAVTDLTVEQAVEKAIAYSRTLKNLDESIEIAEIDEMVTRYAWQSSLDSTSTVSYSIALKNLRNSLKNYDADKEVEKNKIEYNIKQLFYGLKDAQRSIELYDEGIDLSSRQLEIYKVMLKVGKLSQVEYDAQVTSHENLVASKLALENSMSAAYRTLNQLMGENVNNKYNIIIEDKEFTPVSSQLDLDITIARALSSNQTVKKLEDTVDIAKYTSDTYGYRGSTGVTTSDKESIDSQYNQASRGLGDTKTALTSSIKTVYENIKNTESTYAQNAAKLRNMEEQLLVKETQLKLGKITQIELDQFKYSMEQLKAQQESAVRSYDLLVMQFNNSNLIM